jgi:hypothetical protein
MPFSDPPVHTGNARFEAMRALANRLPVTIIAEMPSLRASSR